MGRKLDRVRRHGRVTRQDTSQRSPTRFGTRYSNGSEGDCCARSSSPNMLSPARSCLATSAVAAAGATAGCLAAVRWNREMPVWSCLRRQDLA